MKIGVSSYSFAKYLTDTQCGYKKICDIAKEIGYDGIEFIGLVNEKWGITGDPIEIAKELREYCASIGLEIVAYTVGANFLSEDPVAEVEKIKRCVDVCEALGAPVMRHDVAYKLKPEHLYTWEDAIADMAPYIREVSEYAAAKGIRTCSENHGYIFQAPERVEALINAVGSKNYGWLVDMGNFLCADCDPEESVYIASNYAFHVHAKDFLYMDGNQPMPDGYFSTAGGNYLRGTIVGHGVVPVRKCVNIMKRAGYDGYLSLEFEGLEDNLTAVKYGYRYLKSVVE